MHDDASLVVDRVLGVLRVTEYIKYTIFFFFFFFFFKQKTAYGM